MNPFASIVYKNKGLDKVYDFAFAAQNSRIETAKIHNFRIKA